MAQQDTGLGWSAKDDWLVSGDGIAIGTINATIGDGTLPELPVCNPTVADIVANGLLVATSTVQLKTYVAAADPGVFVYGRQYDMGSGWDYCDIIALCANTNTEIYVVSYDTSTHTGSVNTTYATTQVSGTQLYRSNPAISLWLRYHTIAASVPVYTGSINNTASSAATHLTVVADNITKDNEGYAVAAVARWRTESNAVIETPILISSVPESVDMTSSLQIYFAKLSIQRDGMRFYMGFFQNTQYPITVPTGINLYDISSPDDPYATLNEIFNLICAADQANVKVTETVDPYEDFGNTEEDSGEVDPDPEDDEIEEADLPTMSFATAGFCRIYRPSFSQVSALASYMWTDTNFLQTVINHLKQILENPIDAIISLSIVPCVPNVLTDEEVKVMYVPTGVYMPPVQRQFVSVDCGTYTLKEMYGSALDYNPYTSVQLYLPYVGIVQLDTDEVMGKTLSIGYRIDVVTGVCCAYVKAGGDVLYQFSGHCSIQQPITSADFSGYINAALAAGKLVASIAAAGAGAPAVAATLANAPTPSISGSESKTVETERNPNTGRQITVGTRKQESQTFNPGASFGEIATRGVSNTVGAVMNSKTIVQHSGGFSGNSGFMAAVRRPYLIVTRPRIANPENYGKYNGRPSMIYLNLGDCTGFTQVQSIQLTGIDATNPELSEIATLLNSGVIL